MGFYGVLWGLYGVLWGSMGSLWGSMGYYGVLWGKKTHPCEIANEYIPIHQLDQVKQIDHSK